jgi:hypothetical protein
MARSPQATDRLTKRKRAPRRKDYLFKPATLDELAEALQAIRERTLYRNALESRERLYRALCRRAFADHALTFNTTITQLGAAAGYPVSGNRRADEQRFGQNIRRALADLEAAGLISWNGVKRPDGAWRCIEVSMTHENGRSASRASGLTYPPLSCVTWPRSPRLAYQKLGFPLREGPLTPTPTGQLSSAARESTATVRFTLPGCRLSRR